MNNFLKLLRGRDRTLDILEKVEWPSHMTHMITLDASSSLFYLSSLTRQADFKIDAFETRIQDYSVLKQAFARNQAIQLDAYDAQKIAESSIIYDSGFMWLEASQQKNMHSLQTLCQKVKKDCPIFIAGANEEGIKSWQDKFKKWNLEVSVVANARGARVLQLNNPQNIDGDHSVKNSFVSAQINSYTLDFLAPTGVFCEAQLDTGTRILLEHLPSLENKKVWDFGCGTGSVSLFAQHQKASEIWATDSDYWAVLATISNCQKISPTVEAHWSFLNESIELPLFDIIITNPPFHVVKSLHLEIGDIWLKSCYKQLQTNGQIWLVCNQFLKYREFAQNNKLNAELIIQKSGFHVWKMTKI